MNFHNFITEAPLEIDVSNDTHILDIKFERLSNKQPIRHDEYEKYTIVVYDSPYKNNEEVIVLIEDTPLLYLSQYIEKHAGKKLIRNAYVNKSKALDGESLTKILFYLAKEYDGMISDDTQSTGGKKMWKTLMSDAIKLGYKIGIYDNTMDKISFKDNEISFNLWYALKSKEIYSRTNLESAAYQLVIIK